MNKSERAQSNTQRVIRLPIEVPYISLSIFATYGRALSCNKITLRFPSAIIEHFIIGSKHDLNQLIVIDNAQ